MGSFTDSEIGKQALDWQILRDGGISLYLRPALLQADVEWLQAHGYQIKDFDSGTWLSEASMHDALASALSFPPYYGNNLNALNECMSEDLAVPLEGGLVMVLRQFDRFAAASDKVRTVLDIFAFASRHHMLSGRRLIVLIQSDDPRISFTGLGGVHAAWNRREWLIEGPRPLAESPSVILSEGRSPQSKDPEPPTHPRRPDRSTPEPRAPSSAPAHRA